MDYRDTAGTLLLLSSSRRRADEDVQAGALLIVEQIRDYKDTRYIRAHSRLPKSRDSNTPLQRNAAQRRSGRGPGYGFETQPPTSRRCTIHLPIMAAHGDTTTATPVFGTHQGEPSCPLVERVHTV